MRRRQTNETSIGAGAIRTNPILESLWRKPQRLLWLLPWLMAMDGPGCVMSEHPLTRSSPGGVDTSILGEWVEPGDAGEDEALDIRLRADGTLELRIYDGTEYTLMTGHTSIVDGETWVNLQFVDAGCDDCAEDERQRIRARFRQDYATVLPDNPANDCTWMVVRYRHEAGRLRFGQLDETVLRDAISSGDLPGRAGPGQEEGYQPCVTASPRRFRRYLSGSGAEVLAPMEDDWFVR